MDSKFVISVNRVRDLIFVLAVFDLVFVLDLSFKSTSTQNESCRSSFPLQLLFWPNFMFPYQILSFRWSKSGQTRVQFIQWVHCSSPVLSYAAHTAALATGECLHASTVAPIDRRANELIRSRCRLLFLPHFIPILRLTRS